MPRTINPIRKALLKKSILRNKGKNIKGAMIEAGYAESTAKRSNANKSVQIITAEIERDITKEITVKSVLESLKRIQTLALSKGDFSTATRCEELCGKWLAMFTDKQEISQADKEDNQFSLERLSRIKVDNSVDKCQ